MRNFILYTTPVIIRMIKSRMMMWVGCVAYTEGSVEKRNACRMLLGKYAGKNNFK